MKFTDKTKKPFDPRSFTRPLGEMLVNSGIITEKQLEEALKYQKNRKVKLGTALVELGYIDEEELAKFLGRQLGYPYVTLEKLEIPDELLRILPYEFMKRNLVVPVEKRGNILVLAMSDPLDQSLINEVSFLTSLHVEPVVCPEKSILNFLEERLSRESEIEKLIPKEIMEMEDMEIVEETEGEEGEEKPLVEEAPIVKFTHFLIVDAIRKDASDIHIEPYESLVRIRYRIDGVLHDVMTLPTWIKNSLASRVKVMSGMDIAEKRLPQDGRFKMKIGGREMDFRVSSLPTMFGEKIVIRILDPGKIRLDLSTLGFEEEQLKKFRKAINLPYGMILVTGPTGSGKTTTLYAALSELNKTEVNISTVEDPVEYYLPGINQVQVNETAGLTFATALRAFLRQDPDIIMVGEIRDIETAEISIRAALTGHLVLSTLHTNDAPSAVGRLIDMGVEPYLVSSSVVMVVAQRLVRLICENCKEKTKPNPEILKELGVDPDNSTFYKGKGCKKCNYTGYRGRIAIYEIMEVTPTIRELAVKKSPSEVIRKAALEEGMITLRESGIRKVKKGLTTLEEVLRTTSLD